MTTNDAEMRASFDEFWAQEIANNGGVAVGADYREWAKKGYEATTRRAGAREMLAAGEDTTGLCTVRHVAAVLIKSGDPLLEMAFDHQGGRVNVEIRVTRICAAAAPEEKKEE